MSDAIIFTCEHGGCEVPPEYAGLFAGHEALLQTHRGWDRGALVLARDLAHAFNAKLFFATTTRLLIDLNRSIGHRQLYSDITRSLPRATRRDIAARHYRPYRHQVESEVARLVAAGQRVVHIASHSFTPQLGGHVRQADVAWLYDPARQGERLLALQWLLEMQAKRPDLRLRRNYPYQGKGDGLTSLLRKRHAPERYLGIELEVSQRFAMDGSKAWDQLRRDICGTLGGLMCPGVNPGLRSLAWMGGQFPATGR